MLNRKSLFVVLVLSIFIANSLSAQNLYKYDDDKSDVNFALMSNNEGQQVGMHFVVGKEAQVIDKIMIFVVGGNIDKVKANIHIVKLDENNLEVVIPFTPYAIEQWNEVSLLDKNINISGNVMIGIEWVTPTGEKEPFTSFFIGADLDVSNHNGYIKHPNGDWYPARRFGSSGAKNFYIRLVTKNL